jgi:hypothetical protein
VVLAALTQKGGWALQYASAELKNDKEVVLVAVAQNGRALVHASVELKNDKEVVLAAVARNGLALQFAPAKLKNDKEVVLAAVASFGHALQFASAALKSDKEVVLAAVAWHGNALCHASIARGELQAFVRGRVVAHCTFGAFLLAAHPSTGPVQSTLTPRAPAPWMLDGVGEDANRHVQQLIASFAGAPCGQAWVVTCTACARLLTDSAGSSVEMSGQPASVREATTDTFKAAAKAYAIGTGSAACLTSILLFPA